MSRESREAKAKKGTEKAKERAERANAAADAFQKKGEQAGHGAKLTRAEIKAAKEKEKNV